MFRVHLVFCYCLFSLITNNVLAEDVPSANSLLRGIEDAYSKHKAFQVVFSVSCTDDESFRNANIECNVETSSNRMRFEQTNTDNSPEKSGKSF
jgi:hypothetical protein